MICCSLHLPQACADNVKVLIELLEYLGFVINYNKSSFEPSQRAEFLSITYDSRKMALELPEDKKRKSYLLSSYLLLLSPCKFIQHPLAEKLSLMASKLSGSRLEEKDCLACLSISLKPR